MEVLELGGSDLDKWKTLRGLVLLAGKMEVLYGRTGGRTDEGRRSEGSPSTLQDHRLAEFVQLHDSREL